MAFEMVYAQRRYAQREGERIGDAGADQERTGEARPLGVGDGVELGELRPGLAHHPADQRQHAPDMVARGEFRDHAPVFLVHRDLGVQRVRQQAALAVIQRDAGFVAGGFYAQDQHAAGFNAGSSRHKKGAGAARYDTRLCAAGTGCGQLRPGKRALPGRTAARAWLNQPLSAPGKC